MTSSRTILVVEDNPLTRKMLRVTLEMEGYSVIEAEDGRTALAAATAEMPDLVLQDLILPDMNGFELVRMLRELPGGADAPILALSGFLSRIEEARTARAGFTALLVKPIEPSRLVDIVRVYFPASRHSEPPLPLGRRILLVDDDPVQLKLSKIHLEQLGYEVAAVSSAIDALRAARAFPPDLVLADVLMPGLDGFQLCFELRRDPLMAGIPVVLTSSWYHDQAHRELAQRVGASALVDRTPNQVGAVDALRKALRDGPPPFAAEPNDKLMLDHAKAVIGQLEHQLRTSSELARRCTLQAAQISLLGGFADALTRELDTDAALHDVLAAILDAAGISKGAIFLRGDGEALVLRSAIGFSPLEAVGLPTFFGLLTSFESVIERQATVAIPSSAIPEEVGRVILSRADVASAQIVPLVADGRGAGAILLGAKRTDVTNADSIGFARAMGNQLAQSMELANSFSRLAASEQRYRTVTEGAYDAISILKPNGTILEANRSLEEAVGLPKDQIIGRNIRELAALLRDDKEDPGTATDAPDRTSRRVLTRPDGSVVQMEFSNREIDVAGERLVFSIGRDITAQVQAQTQLMVADRMASVGSLAAGVAHEINNPLAAVTANLEFAVNEVMALEGKFGPGELAELKEVLAEAREAAERVRIITRDLKGFSRAEEERSGPVDLHRVLESSLRMASNELRHRAAVTKDFERIPLVEANESRLCQVFLNLIVNAAQAIPEGHANVNAIRIRTRHDLASDRVIVEVEDTGPGIPPELMPRLFTPFFTTKPEGIGTGLGLSICQRIVTQLGGEITVESKIGVGTVFRVFLSTSRAEAVGSQTRRLSSLAPPMPKRGQILVIDDERLIGNIVRRMLSSEHDVATSDSATEALERITGGQEFDVILCDLMMPVMTGAEFHRELSLRAPEQACRIVFLTGGAFTVNAREFLDGVSNLRVEKPFEIHTLRNMVIKQLGATRASLASPLL